MYDIALATTRELNSARLLLKRVHSHRRWLIAACQHTVWRIHIWISNILAILCKSILDGIPWYAYVHWRTYISRDIGTENSTTCTEPITPTSKIGFYFSFAFPISLSLDLLHYPSLFRSMCLYHRTHGYTIKFNMNIFGDNER